MSESLTQLHAKLCIFKVQKLDVSIRPLSPNPVTYIDNLTIKLYVTSWLSCIACFNYTCKIRQVAQIYTSARFHELVFSQFAINNLVSFTYNFNHLQNKNFVYFYLHICSLVTFGSINTGSTHRCTVLDTTSSNNILTTLYGVAIIQNTATL